LKAGIEKIENSAFLLFYQPGKSVDFVGSKGWRARFASRLAAYYNPHASSRSSIAQGLCDLGFSARPNALTRIYFEPDV